MKKLCNEANLPVPELSAKGQDFWIVFRKEIDLSVLNLNNRQLDAIKFFKATKEITTSEYMKRYNVAERTAREDLSEMVEKRLLVKQGETKSVKYIYAE